MAISINDNFFKVRNSVLYNEHVKRDIKISALGDIHLSEKLVTGRKLDMIKYQLQSQNPDYIFLLGDMIDDPKVLENPIRKGELTDFFIDVCSIAQTMLILGSHDFADEINGKGILNYNEEYWGAISNICNMHLLNNSTYYDSNIFVMGYFQTLEYYYNLIHQKKEDSNALYQDFKPRVSLYKNLPNNVPKIALFHSGIGIEEARNANLIKDYDAILCGHTHNGCVPIILDEILRYKSLKNIGIISPKKQLLAHNIRGIVDLNIDGKFIPLINSGGIIKLQECAPKFIQFCNMICPMQMDVMTITSDLDKVRREHSKYVKVKK